MHHLIMLIKKVIVKNYTSFTNCIRKIKNTEVDVAHYIDVIMPMFSLIKYNDKNSKASGILSQYCIDEPAINAANGNISNFNADNATTDSLKIKELIILIKCYGK